MSSVSHSTTNPLSQGGMPIFPISRGTEARGGNFLSPLKNEGGNYLGGIAPPATPLSDGSISKIATPPNVRPRGGSHDPPYSQVGGSPQCSEGIVKKFMRYPPWQSGFWLFSLLSTLSGGIPGEFTKDPPSSQRGMFRLSLLSRGNLLSGLSDPARQRGSSKKH